MYWLGWASSFSSLIGLFFWFTRYGGIVTGMCIYSMLTLHDNIHYLSTYIGNSFTEEVTFSIFYTFLARLADRAHLDY